MRSEFRWASAAAAALSVGVLCSVPYARLAAPYYGLVASLIAEHRPWDVASVGVEPGRSSTAELQLHGTVRRHRADRNPAARVIGHVQVGEAVETPVVFWTIVCVWRAVSLRQRALRVFLGFPVFLVLEAITTATQLLLPMAQASAILAGHTGPTAWDYWSRFLEAGGQFAVVCGAAILVASCVRPLEQPSGLPRIRAAPGGQAGVAPGPPSSML